MLQAAAGTTDDSSAGVSQAEQVYEEAITALPTAAMYELYCKFFQQQLHDADGTGHAQHALRGPAKQWAKKLLALQERAIAAGTLQDFAGLHPA